jgi:hypothetical protein
MGSLLGYGVSLSMHVVSSGGIISEDMEKWTLPNLKHYPRTFLENVRTATESLSKVSQYSEQDLK